jgi:hypothetical protein
MEEFWVFLGILGRLRRLDWIKGMEVEGFGFLWD